MGLLGYGQKIKLEQVATWVPMYKWLHKIFKVMSLLFFYTGSVTVLMFPFETLVEN